MDKQERASGKGYSVSDLSRQTQPSRSTIGHYERLGILRPDQDDPSGGRRRRNARRLSTAIILRNLGLSP